MRLSITADGFWRLDLIREEELEMISEIVATACPTDDAALRRLAPDPVPNELEGQQELLEDWDELVRPEIFALLDSALETVQLDLALIRALSPDEITAGSDVEDEVDLPLIFGLEGALEDDEDESSCADIGPLFRLDVPLSHVEDWAKTLNRARLAFAASYDLLVEDALSPATIIMLVERGGQQAIDEYLRSELYGFLLAFLVDEAMLP